MTAITDAPLLSMVGGTPLLELDLFRTVAPDVDVLAKAEFTNPGGSLKDRPVKAMLLAALAAGELEGTGASASRRLLDSSSGNAGIAYAMLGAALGVPVSIVIPGNASTERKRRIRAHEAELIETDPLEGYDEALRHARTLAAAEPERYFHCDQYGNEANWRAHYEETAAELLDQSGGRITHLVCGIGTGGSLTGLGRRLKEHAPDIEVIAVIPDDFPGIEGLKPLGDPEDIVPQILDESVIDHRHTTRLEEAAAQCEQLAHRGLFTGQSSGAYLAAVESLLPDLAPRTTPLRPGRARIATLLCDTGERYFSTGLWDR